MVELSEGQSLRFTCQFTHQGAAFSGAMLYAAIGRQGAVAFDEILSAQSSPLSFLYDATPQIYVEYVTIGPISVGITGISPGTDYEAYVKLINIPGADIFWYGPLDDIHILAGEALFSNLTVTYQKA